MREFAEQEIRIPDGPLEGFPFRCRRQPYTQLFYDAIDSGRYRRVVVTGPSQSGKTLSAFVIPTLYHLFEVGETVIVGLPDLNMSSDKWTQDLLPAIERSRYRSLLPDAGDGSRGGKPTLIRFKNGASLRFMSGGGGDKQRAGFTGRVLVITETDGMDTRAGSSEEADKISQLEARTRAYGDQARIYMECTVTTEDGRTWRDYQTGTASRIAQRCPHCGEYVTLTREDLRGWEDAETELDAETEAAFVCPECSALWSDEDRKEAAAASVLVHRGQEVGSDGIVTGEHPRTPTLGFRWSAPDNLFASAGVLGVDEWRGARDPNEDNAERRLSQFVWANPYQSDVEAMTSLDANAIAARVGQAPRGLVPDGCVRLTVGCDVGKRLCHWVAIAWLQNGTGFVVDYDVIEVAADSLGAEQALILALRDWRDERLMHGWGVGDGGSVMRPDVVAIDSGYETDTVYAWTNESGKGVYPAKGFGTTQRAGGKYRSPKKKSSSHRFVGEEYHVARLPAKGVDLVEVDADWWKSWLHERLAANVAAPGALRLWDAPVRDHFRFAKHLTAERQTEEYQEGKGRVIRWEQVNRQNHFLDAAYLACVAGHMAGIRLPVVDRKPAAPPAPRPAAGGPKGGGSWINRATRSSI